MSLTMDNNQNRNCSLSLKPDILVFQVIEAKALNMDLLKNNSPKGLPYCIAELDRNEVVINGVSGSVSEPVWKYRARFDISRIESSLTITIYVKAVLNTNKPATVNQLILGSIKLDLKEEMANIENSETVIDKFYELDKGGKIRIQTCYKQQKNVQLDIEQFELLKVIGKGSFGKVLEVKKKDTKRIYAMKILKKSSLVTKNEVIHTMAERQVLAKIDHPFIVPLKFSFQSRDKLYLVLAFINGGELFYHLQAAGKFEETRARFYAAELLSALECLHGYKIIYRDLKPENILIDSAGHIALCDFGLCKLNMKQDDTTNTFCGTPEYLAPELLTAKSYTKCVDWWTLGVLLYEMLSGLPPFYDEDTNIMYKRILTQKLTFPSHFSEEAKSILERLLDRNPDNRLGRNGAQEIKEARFFGGIDWGKLDAKQLEPPFKPDVKSETDVSNFDEEFTNEIPKDSIVTDSKLSETAQKQFEGFTFEGDVSIMSSIVDSVSNLKS